MGRLKRGRAIHLPQVLAEYQVGPGEVKIYRESDSSQSRALTTRKQGWEQIDGG